MNTTIKDFFEIGTYIVGCIVVVWKVAESRELLRDEIQQLDKKVDLHIQSSLNARQNLEEKIYGQGKRFGAKFDRLENRINDAIDFKFIISKLDAKE